MITSRGQVELSWPGPSAPALGERGGPTLAEVRAEFEMWLGEAKRRGCPDDAPVHIPNPGYTGPYDLAVIWDAGPPKVTLRGPL